MGGISATVRWTELFVGFLLPLRDYLQIQIQKHMQKLNVQRCMKWMFVVFQ